MADNQAPSSFAGQVTSLVIKSLIGADKWQEKDAKGQFALRTMAQTWHADVLHAKLSPAELEAAEASWQEKYREVIREREKAVLEAQEKTERECEAEIREKKKCFEREIQELTKDCKSWECGLEKKNEELESLKSYRVFKKESVTDSIVFYKQQIASSQNQIKKKKLLYENLETDIRKEYEQKKKRAAELAAARFPVPESPKQRSSRIREYMDGYTAGVENCILSLWEINGVVRDYIPVLLNCYGEISLKKMADIMGKFLHNTVGVNAAGMDEFLIQSIQNAVKEHYSDRIGASGTLSDFDRNRQKYRFKT